MPELSPRRPSLDSFLPQFANGNGHGSPGLRAGGPGQLELASDAASIWLAASHGHEIADQFLDDLRQGEEEARLQQRLGDPVLNGQAVNVQATNDETANGETTIEHAAPAQLAAPAINGHAQEMAAQEMALIPSAPADSNGQFHAEPVEADDAHLNSGDAEPNSDDGHSNNGESGEVELLALDDVADEIITPAANASINALVADPELVDVMSHDEPRPLSESNGHVHVVGDALVDVRLSAERNGHAHNGELIVSGQVENVLHEPEIATPADCVEPSPPPVSGLLNAPPSAVPLPTATLPTATVPTPALPQQARPAVPLGDHPATGSLFSPYLVTEVPTLRKRAARKGWWRRLFG